MNGLIVIDGSKGEGGGQILRSSLALSMITGRPFRIENIRAGREKPGLLREHLTAVKAAMEVCAGIVHGAAIGARWIEFHPGKIASGQYRFSIGSAGSTTLVLQSVLPALLCAEGPSTVVLEGGTHNPHAPPVDFLGEAFAGVVNRMGPTVSVSLERYGFYPAGGGCVCVTVDPAKTLTPMNLDARGAIVGRMARAVVADLPGAIAKRELDRIGMAMRWSGEELKILQAPRGQGPGNILSIAIRSENVTEVITGFGLRGVSAEAVADGAIEEAQRYLDAEVPVGEYLADQLMIPFALAGDGSFVTSELSLHATTNIDTIGRFLDVKIGVRELGARKWRVEVGAQ